MLDLEQHLLRQMAFSRATFGPGARTEGVLDHIAEEIEEVRAAEDRHRALEWVDIVILALDGLTRELRFSLGAGPEMAAEVACEEIRRKQSKNEARDWPDWRTQDPEKKIKALKGGEHVEVAE